MLSQQRFYNSFLCEPSKFWVRTLTFNYGFVNPTIINLTDLTDRALCNFFTYWYLSILWPFSVLFNMNVCALHG